ncbi:protein-tyrosine phosphatase-like protein [Kalaharituber pfeilii]|nr:protein-tyrosine phosphatase-like protein [Kalaharituber pfeilii]
MPHSSRETVYGNVIEPALPCLLYFPPTTSTPFPPPAIPSPHYGPHASSSTRGTATPSKRSRRTAEGLNITPGQKPVYFTIDDHLLYNAFFHDFGPLHIGHLYRFAVMLHDILGDKQNEGRSVVFWSKCDARSRANAATILACYMVLIQSWPPHLALAPIAQCDPPLMPFRDAGYSQADFVLSVQDVVYGVYRAKEKNVLNIKEFSLEEYERFERVDMGDFNWVTPNFLAFASPQQKPPQLGEAPPHIPTTLEEVAASSLNQPFKNVLHHFQTRDIGLVVRLNEELYPAQYFTALGITHLDMYFDDGTCPPLNLVRRFINLAHCAITVHKKNIAVHCKAGLGRTGCLIGAYLVYRYGFTANEVIAFMRFMRPGMVVGPQQHWLHLNQNEFRQWWYEDNYAPAQATAAAAAALTTASGGLGAALKLTAPVTPTKSKRIVTGTPPSHGSGRRTVLGEVDANNNNDINGQAASGGSACTGGAGHHSALPAPTPGQPRKTSKRFGMTSARVPSTTSVYEDENVEDQNVDPENLPPPPPPPPYQKSAKAASGNGGTVVGAVTKYDPAGNSSGGEEMSEDEFLLHQTMTATRRTSATRSRSSARTKGATGKRSVSYTMTTTTTSTTTVTGTPPGVPPGVMVGVGVGVGVKGMSGSGVGSGVVGAVKTRSSPRRREGKDDGLGHEGRSKAGVRKVSGRVGSVGHK